MANRRTFTEYEKKTIYANGNGRCALCGKPLEFKKMTVDHKTPLSKGGTNALDNLQPACRVCNFMKQDMLMEELVEQMLEVLRFQFKKKIRKVFLIQ